MRAFISVNLNESLHEEIGRLQQSLESEVRGVRWTKPQNCHLTLKFLGEISDLVLDTLGKSLPGIGQALDPFSIEIGGLGCFPKNGPLSILWIGASQGGDELSALENAIREPLIKSGISFDKKPFVPHLTIGRAKRNQRASFTNLEACQDTVLGKLSVDAFYLMESKLLPTGPVYTERLRVPLG